MKKSLLNHVRPLVVCIAGLCIMVFFAACSGVATTTNSNGTTTSSITGKLVSVNPSTQSATFSTNNNQQVTVNQLPSDLITQLQSRVGQQVTLTVTQNGNTYNFSANTSVTANGTPVATANTTTTTSGQPTTTAAVEPGKLDFYGKVQSINASGITVAMPNGDAITMAINAQTDRDSDFANGQPTIGQQIELKGITNQDGTFTATKLGFLKQDDLSDTVKLNTVDFEGVTTSTVGSDKALHFTVGNKPYTFTLNTATTEIKHFNTNQPQAIPNNQPVKVTVQFNGSNGTVTKVENNADNQ
jgi:hypothetical protein